MPDDSIQAKADHVRRAPNRRIHACPWPGCPKLVPLAMWGCREHWYKLPAKLRAQVWAAYKVGQEDDKRLVSKAYVEAARAVEAWLAANVITEGRADGL